MTDRPHSPTRAPSIPSRPSMSRPTSLRIPNPDVFSDDYAVDGSPDISPVDSIQRFEDLSLPTSQPRASIVSPPTTYTHFSRPTSTAKRTGQDGGSIPHRAVSSVSRADSTAQRTSSTSSRFSMPRAQSPYVGSTGPSHPYAMYPQVTRASSVASESTVRPFERPFQPTAPPEHPYAMYPQNTLPEDEDDAIPLGFPGMGTNYQTRAAGHDIAHLVGSDGHIEELPPYTRYAAHVVPKEASPDTSRAVMPIPLSPMSQHSDSGVGLSVGAARDVGVNEEKTGWKSKAQKRVCAGLPLWALILIITIILLAASLGGVVGGVVGNDRGADSVASAHATTTIYLDGVPAPTYTPSPSSCPDGQYTVTIESDPNAADSNSCIKDPAYAAAWSCLPPQTGIGITIVWTDGEGPATPQVSFDNYTQLPANFSLGPQPPNLPKIYTLGPYTDRDDGNLGVALFFWTTYSKLTILPGDHFGSGHGPSVSYAEISSRDPSWFNIPAEIGSEVWSCSFDGSIFEFFLYPNDTSSAEDVSVPSTPTSTSTSTSCSQFSSATSSGSIPTPFTSSIPLTGPTPTAAASASQAWTSSDWSWPSSSSYDRRRRDFSLQPRDLYPKSIKMLEKRRSSGNIPSYCTKMRVQEGWSLEPVAGVSPVLIEEVDFNNSATSTSKARMRMKRDSTQQLQANCACEYINF